MKKITLKLLIGFLLVGISSSITAQNTFDVGTKWYYQKVDDFTFSAKVMEITGDTIIAGQSCSVLDGGWFPCSGIRVNYIYKAEGKIFYYNENTTDFSLLYDFTAMPGDTLLIDIFDGGSSTAEVIIDSLGQITLDGVIHQVQYFHSNVCYWGDYFIEGIGSNVYFLPSGPLCCSPSGPLRCYINDDQNIDYHFANSWFDVDFPCDTSVVFVGTDDIELVEKMDIYPNPVSNVLTIRIPDLAVQEKEISILDINGKRIKYWKSNDEIIEMNTSMLTSGIYYVKVVAQGFTQMKPFVKID